MGVKESVDGSAAARHGGIEGTLTIQVLFEESNTGMVGKDSGLEIVDDKVSPLLDGLADGLSQIGSLRGIGLDATVGFASGDSIGRFEQHQPIGTKVCLDGLEDVTNAGGIGGGVADEERTVGSELDSQVGQLAIGEIQVEELSQHQQHKSGVAAAAAKSCPEGYALVESHGDRPHLGTMTLQETVGTHTEVVVGGTVDDDALLLKGELLGGDDFELVAQGHGDKEGLQVVVAVGPTSHHMEPEVDFAMGMGDHGMVDWGGTGLWASMEGVPASFVCSSCEEGLRDGAWAEGMEPRLS